MSELSIKNGKIYLVHFYEFVDQSAQTRRMAGWVNR